MMAFFMFEYPRAGSGGRRQASYARRGRRPGYAPTDPVKSDYIVVSTQTQPRMTAVAQPDLSLSDGMLSMRR
jgi:hypothetical protein